MTQPITEAEKELATRSLHAVLMQEVDGKHGEEYGITRIIISTMHLCDDYAVDFEHVLSIARVVHKLESKGE